MKGSKRRIYLSMRTLKEAREIWASRTSSIRVEVEKLPPSKALHRVTAGPVFARLSVPHYHGAAMDGYAVKAEKTFGASDVKPLQFTVGHDAFAVNTGDPMPSGTDAVIMVEHVEPVGDNKIEIRNPVFPWQNVRKVGEDIVAGELLLPQCHRLRPVDIGALLAAGVEEVQVYKKPRVWIQPTGTELIPITRITTLKPGQIPEFNGPMLAGLVAEAGGEGLLQDIVDDSYDGLIEAVRKAAVSTADVIIINAGSSAGSEDYAASVIGELGEVFVHGVAMMPGKPVILGMIRGKPVVGIPGYPVSAVIAFEQFVRPLIFSLQGLSLPPAPEVEAILARKLPSRLGLEEFVRVILGRVRNQLVAMPVQRGAGIITSLTRADGVLQIPQEQEGINMGEVVRVRVFRSLEEIQHTIIMIGSHDNTIDLLANELRHCDNRIHLSSSNVGSLGGLMAIRGLRAHLAGSHLLDTRTGEYNRSYVEKYLKGIPLYLVQLAKRKQGLIVRSGNPKKIEGIQDLIRPDVRFINRQGGSGTRILLDYELERRGLSPSQINGYEQEEYTHMAVAVAVLSGAADCGLGIYAAAKALGLDFIPLVEERYDLVIPEYSWDDSKIQLILKVIRSKRFREMVIELGGYDPSESGKVEGIWNGNSWVT